MINRRDFLIGAGCVAAATGMGVKPAAAAVINLPCDWKSAFIMDPSIRTRLGYLVAFGGLGYDDFLRQDITVFTPNDDNATYNTPYEGALMVDAKKLACFGVIDSFLFGGGIGDPISVSAYISAENAQYIMGLDKYGLRDPSIQFGWLILNYDSENKTWYQEAYPLDSGLVSGQIAMPGGQPRIMVSPEATRIAPNIDINVYNLYFEAVPADKAQLHFASNYNTKFVRSWGG